MRPKTARRPISVTSLPTQKQINDHVKNHRRIERIKWIKKIASRGTWDSDKTLCPHEGRFEIVKAYLKKNGISEEHVQVTVVRGLDKRFVPPRKERGSSGKLKLIKVIAELLEYRRGDMGGGFQVQFASPLYPEAFIPCETLDSEHYGYTARLYSAFGPSNKDHLAAKKKALTLLQNWPMYPIVKYTPQQQKEMKRTVQPRGLKNLGNTCFLNGVLQCLFSFDSFVQCFRGKELATCYRPPAALEPRVTVQRTNLCLCLCKGLATSHGGGQLPALPNQVVITICEFAFPTLVIVGSLADALTTLVVSLETTGELNNAVLQRILSVISKYGEAGDFTNAGQHDAYELVIGMLECLHKQSTTQTNLMQNRNPVRTVKDLFCGEHQTVLKCQGCHHFRKVLAHDRITVNQLAVPYPTTGTDANFNVNLVDILKRTYFPDKERCDNKMLCDYCNKMLNFEWDTCLRLLPQLLVFSMNRFMYCTDKERTVRRAFLVDFPQVLDMQPYCNACLLGAAPLLYDLVAVLHHKSDSSDEGHYTVDAVRGGVWVNFNDKQTRFNVSASVKSQTACMLFYKAWPLTPMTTSAWEIMTPKERSLYNDVANARKR